MSNNVKIAKKNKPRIVPMYDMKNGEIGVITDENYEPYNGEVVKANTFQSKIDVFGLGSNNSHWVSTEPGQGRGLKVEILEPGTIIEITVTSI